MLNMTTERILLGLQTKGAAISLLIFLDCGLVCFCLIEYDKIYYHREDWLLTFFLHGVAAGMQVQGF